jgi:hypothetical protein
MTTDSPASALIASTLSMYQQGKPLMRRILPEHEAVRMWDHYPVDDVISPATGARYFYHVHPPEERGLDEHGHFHLFLPRLAMPDPLAPMIVPPNRAAQAEDAVHIAALSINSAGIPNRLFTVNRWVTDEWLFSASDIVSRLDHFDLSDAPGDGKVNKWLTAAVALCRPIIATLLSERDIALKAAEFAGENRSFEILSAAPVDLQSLVDAATA